jgi:membrane associated rhomboid family serine protease
MLFPFRDNNRIQRTPVVTYALVAANVLALLWLGRLPENRQQAFVLEHGFVPARLAQLVDHQPITVRVPQGRIRTPEGVATVVFERTFPPSSREILLSLVTCMFLHGGWLHLAGNMWFLWIFGNNVEDRLGPVVYSLFYLGGGVLAGICHWAFAPNSTAPVIGASGAVAVILGAYAITWPWAKVETLVFLFVFVTIIELPALLVLGAWFVGQVLEATHALGAGGNGVGGHTGVAWWAHIGGFLTGVFLMPLLGDLAGAGSAERRSEQEGTDETLPKITYPPD